MYVYLITDGTYYKIGKTKNIDNRIKQLSTGSSSELSVLKFYKSDKFYSRIESVLHRFYNQYRVNLEWFDLPLDDIILFQEVCKKIENNFNFLEENKI